MKSAVIPVLGMILLSGAMASAQDTPPKVEASLDYSYVHANPQNNNIIPTFSLNGGGGAAAFYFSKYVGIEAEFEGYGSYTHNFSVPPPYCNGPCAVSAQGNLFTYNVGPIVKFRTSHFEPFVETLFGGAHSNFYGNLYTQCGTGCAVASRSPSNNAFDFLIGGGIDIPVNEHIAIRPAQFEYLLTRFGNDFTHGNNNQSNFRYQAGVVFRFGGAPPPPPNRSLVATCSANPNHVTAGSGDTILVRANATGDYNPLVYTWTATGGTIDGTGYEVRWNPVGLAMGTYSVTVRVDDGRGGATSCVAEIRVDPRPNRPPTISCSASPSSVRPGGRVHINAKASDPDNDRLTFAWQTSGGRIVGSGAEVDVDTKDVAPSHYFVTGQVSDGRGGTAVCQPEFTLEAPPPAVEAKLAIRSIYFPTALPSGGKPDEGLVESQEKTLTSLANDFKEYLASKPDAHLELQGHADHRGTPAYNQALSERRVQITKRFLVGLGIPDANILTKAYGEEDNMTPEQVKQLVEQHPNLSQEKKDKILQNLQIVTLAQNRRVDITLSSTGQQSVRQFPFNAEDALTLLSPGTKKKP